MVQVLPPVPEDCTRRVSELVVYCWVIIYLDNPYFWVVEVLLNPLCIDKSFWFCVTHFSNRAGGITYVILTLSISPLKVGKYSIRNWALRLLTCERKSEVRRGFG